jgi:CHAT domain-containing protein
MILLRSLLFAVLAVGLSGCSLFLAIQARNDVIAGRYSEAIQKMQEMVATSERLGGPNSLSVASNLYYLGEVYRLLGDYPSATAVYERSLKIFEQKYGPDHREVARPLRGLGSVRVLTSDYATGRRFLERALQILERAYGPVHAQVALTLVDLAILRARTGDYDGARLLYERSLRIYEKVDPTSPNVEVIILNIAFASSLGGRYAEAVPLYERAIALMEKRYGPNHFRVARAVTAYGNALWASGERQRGLALYERGLKIFDDGSDPRSPWLAECLAEFGNLRFENGESDQAKPLYSRALAMAKSSDLAEARWTAAFGLGRIDEKEGHDAAAVAHYREAVETLEKLVRQLDDEQDRTRYLRTMDRLVAYDSLAAALLRMHQREPGQGYEREAWAVLEAKKGRLVAESLSTGRAKLPDGQAKDAIERVRAKQDQSVALERLLREEQGKGPREQEPEKVRDLTTLVAQTKREYLDEVQKFLQRYPQYKAQFIDQQTVDPRALAKFAERLPAGVLAVQYFAAVDRLYVFVVAGGGGFQVKTRNVSRDELYGLVREYRAHVNQGKRRQLPWNDDKSDIYRREVAPFKERARVLAHHLLEPIKDELARYRSLVLIPNDLLLYLPLHALEWQPAGEGMRFLAETHSVSYVTQLELTDLFSPDVRGREASLLAIGDPDGSLPGAAREVREVGAIRARTTVLEGGAATKERLVALANQFRDLHLATHGVLDTERPQQSYLVLAGRDSDARLTIGDISGLSLQSSLVVLSACETAVGEQVPGAALTTLAAAFSQAGARAVVASLWEVNDRATAQFMVVFHRDLGQEGRVLALQRAQRTLLANPATKHPYYWAAFLLIGSR